MKTTATNTRAAEIVDFWLADAADSPEAAFDRVDLWYRSGPEFDQEIESKFGADLRAACAGELDDWAADPMGALALVILLDQFTRNTYRNTPDAYCGDQAAFSIADATVRAGRDAGLPVAGRIFLYHPLHHSESLEQQDRVLDLLGRLEEEVSPEWKAYVQRSIKGHGRHRDIVARFGRFPHRNQVLGRPNTAEEDEYLQAGPDAFGQGAKTNDTKTTSG